MQALRRPLREGRLPGCVSPAVVSLRLRVRGAWAHVHGLPAEGVRGGDRRRDARGRRADARGLRRVRALRGAAADVRVGGAVDVPTPRERARLHQSGVRRAARQARRRSACSRASPTSSRLPQPLQHEHADGRAGRGEEEREPPAVRGNCRDNGRRARDDDAEQRLLEAEGGAGARGARSLRGGRVCEPVPRHAQHAGDDEQRDEERERRVDRRRRRRR